MALALHRVYLLFFSFFFRWPDPNFQSARHWVMQPVMFSPLDIHCTAVETLIHGKCYIYVFFIVCKIYFLLVFQRYSITSAMECADLTAFTFEMWQIRLHLLCKFILPEVTIISLFAILRVFLVGFGNWSEFFFIKVS